MVHALEKIHRLLKPGGILIDIHPTTEPPAVEVRLGTRITLAGWVEEADDYLEYAQADEAVLAVVRAGLFEQERRSTFPFLTHAATLAELRRHLDHEWKDAILDDRTAGRIEELMLAPADDREVRIRETIGLRRLRVQVAG